MADRQMDLAEILLSHHVVQRLGNRFFCLGPNVGRINFLSQQIRALNLVWALAKRQVIEPNFLVAVVGGGICGTTAAVALRAYDCSVRVFDQGGRPMHRQRTATHRRIFPNINWWPGEADLDVTTALPFLDWHLARCDEVIAMLDADWERLKHESCSDLQFIGNRTVESAFPDKSRGGRLVLTLDDGKQHDEAFDAVIVASGFGEERPIDGLETPSYWEDDQLESVRDGKKRKIPAIISGFGDGGQIDALRLAFEFKHGDLSFQVAQALQGTPISDEIVAIEASGANSRTYEPVVTELLRNPQYAKVVKLLDAALYNGVRVVILIDPLCDSPYLSGAAPIHKLLVAYADAKSRLEQKRATVTKVEEYGDTAYCVDGEIFDKERNHIVIRHGAETSFNHKLIFPGEWEDLKTRQKASKGYSFKFAWDEKEEPFRVPANWPCPQTNEKGYIEARKPMAQKAIQNMGSGGTVVAATNCFVVVNHDCAFKPKTLFGKPVNYKSMSDFGEKHAMLIG